MSQRLSHCPLIFKRWVIRQVLALVLAASVLTPACDDDGPNGPEPAASYNFYFNDSSFPDRYYRYNTATQTVDTITIPYASYEGFVISGDGQRLYLSNNDTTAIVNTNSFGVDTLLTNLGGAVVAISPDGGNLVVAGEDLWLYDSHAYSVAYHDTVRVSQVTLSGNGQRLYATAGGEAGGAPPYLYRLHLAAVPPTVSRLTFSDGSAWRAVPSVHSELLFLFLVAGVFPNFYFVVYDVGIDSVLFRHYFTPGRGDMEPSLDGKYVFFTNPGTLQAGPPPSVVVIVFDIQENRICDSIRTPSPVHNNMIPSALAISPDGATLVAASARGQGSFSVIDTKSMKVLKHFYLGNQVDILNVICQRLP